MKRFEVGQEYVVTAEAVHVGLARVVSAEGGRVEFEITHRKPERFSCAVLVTTYPPRAGTECAVPSKYDAIFAENALKRAENALKRPKSIDYRARPHDFTIQSSDYAALKAIAKENKTTVSKMMRALIEDFASAKDKESAKLSIPASTPNKIDSPLRVRVRLYDADWDKLLEVAHARGVTRRELFRGFVSDFCIKFKQT